MPRAAGAKLAPVESTLTERYQKGVDLSFRQSFSALAKTKPDVIIEASRKLNDEGLRASALLAITGAILP